MTYSPTYFQLSFLCVLLTLTHIFFWLSFRSDSVILKSLSNLHKVLIYLELGQLEFHVASASEALKVSVVRMCS